MKLKLKLKERVLNFFQQLARTICLTPAESAVACFFMFYGIFAVTDLLVVENHWVGENFYSNFLLYPFVFTLSYVLNRLMPSGWARWIYYLSPLVIFPFFWLDWMMSWWSYHTSFITALCLCPVVVLLHRWRGDNWLFTSETIRYYKNGVFAGGLAWIAFGLVTAIYYSIRVLFDFNWNIDFLSYVGVILGLGVGPLVFLTFDRGQHQSYRPVRIADILVNYVLTPALAIYTVILYAYFIKIAVEWSLPDGVIAYMVFAYTIAAVCVKAYQSLMDKRVLGWFYDRFSYISLPALAMFWVCVARRIGEYGLSVGRIYLLICGGLMTLAVLIFIIPRVAQYRYIVLTGAVLFSLVAFFPGITATDLAIASQQKRFDKVASRLGLLDADGRLILEKLPAATESQEADYAVLYDALEYIGFRVTEEQMEKRFGVRNSYDFQTQVMPDNMPYGHIRVTDNCGRTFYSDNQHIAIDLDGYTFMYHLLLFTPDYAAAYRYSTQNDNLAILAPGGDTLLNRSFESISKHQLAKIGFKNSGRGDVPTMEDLEKHLNEILFYEEGDMGIVFHSVSYSIDSVAIVNYIRPDFLLLKEKKKK